MLQSLGGSCDRLKGLPRQRAALYCLRSAAPPSEGDPAEAGE